jgi:hypothetical protein
MHDLCPARFILFAEITSIFEKRANYNILCYATSFIFLSRVLKFLLATLIVNTLSQLAEGMQNF